jgi:hypothetical protein
MGASFLRRTQTRPTTFLLVSYQIGDHHMFTLKLELRENEADAPPHVQDVYYEEDNAEND